MGAPVEPVFYPYSTKNIYDYRKLPRPQNGCASTDWPNLLKMMDNRLNTLMASSKHRYMNLAERSQLQAIAQLYAIFERCALGKNL